MIDKNNYHKLKKYLRVQSRPQIEKLISDLSLNSTEQKLFLSWYNGDTRVKTCMDSFICDDTYTKYLKTIFSKVYNYFKYQNITF